MEYELDGQVAVVTGAAQGMGRRLAERLASEGVRVALWDRHVVAAQEVRDTLPTPGTAVECDVADPDSVADAMRATIDGVGVPNLCVTAAGIAISAPFLTASGADFSRQLAVNLTGTFLTLQACAAAMVEAGVTGSMVGISSVAGRGPRADLTAYAASKAGVISVVRSAAVALAGHGIRVNAVCPGVVDTQMTMLTQQQRAAAEGITVEQALARLTARIPLGRMQTVDDVADAVLFLMSTGASYVTGQSLNACGGLEFD